VTTTTPRTMGAPTTTVWAGLGVVYLVWGTTYLAIRVLSQAAPPTIAQGLRFVIAGSLLAAFMVARHGRAALAVSRTQLRSAALLGLLFVVCGNGGVAFAEQEVPSSLAALLVAAMPLWVVLLRTFAGHERPRLMTWMGTLVGFAGIAVLARPGSDGNVKWWGVGVVLLATMCWATGTFLTPRLTLPTIPTVTTIYEMLVGGAIMLVISTLTGQWGKVHLSAISGSAWVAFVYLTIVGSLLAYNVFTWLLNHAPVSLVTTYAYVNPVVAVTLGWLILGESVTPALLVGGTFAVVGVALVIRSEGRQEPIEGETV
jgi:drug/metabolite transporter (DMT)-like permease